MYLNFLVNIPIETRKITYRKKGETDYVYYEYTRLYKKGSNITNPKRVTIGKRDTQNPAMMVPNENYLKYFPDEDIPEINDRTKRSSCLRIGAWVVIRKIIGECKFLKLLSRGNVGLNFYLFSFLYSFKGNRRHSYRGAAVIISIISAVPPNHSPGL